MTAGLQSQGSAFGPVRSGSAAAEVVAEAVRHVFDDGFEALNVTRLRAEGGSFCTLLGPSGSGKTTLLRILAGLLRPTEGRIIIGGRDVTALPVQQRGIGFVFQHYALFPHLSAAQNIEYPLKVRGWSKKRRHLQVEKILQLVDLSGFAGRRPSQLSGGQQQRVAVGRALVYDPALLLLDEPLGALDRKLRQQLGRDLRRIQRSAGTTAIYVTHDQDEAFLLSDKVVVMSQGKVLQEGRPNEIYQSPSSLFVAGFLGETNVLWATVEAVDADFVVAQVSGVRLRCRAATEPVVGQNHPCAVRPEDIRLTIGSGPATAGTTVFGQGTVRESAFLGSRYRLWVEVQGVDLVVESNRTADLPEAGAEVWVSWRDRDAVLLAQDHATEPSI